MDLSLTEVILWCIATFIAIRFVSGVLEGWNLTQANDRLELIKHLDDIIHRVKIEKHGEIEYWFDHDDDEFLGQGRNLDEVIQVIKSRFPKHVFILQDLGGIGPQTEWKFVPMAEFKNIKFDLKEESNG